MSSGLPEKGEGERGLLVWNSLDISGWDTSNNLLKLDTAETLFVV